MMSLTQCINEFNKSLLALKKLIVSKVGLIFRVMSSIISGSMHFYLSKIEKNTLRIFFQFRGIMVLCSKKTINKNKYNTC